MMSLGSAVGVLLLLLTWLPWSLLLLLLPGLGLGAPEECNGAGDV